MYYDEVNTLLSSSTLIDVTIVRLTVSTYERVEMRKREGRALKECYRLSNVSFSINQSELPTTRHPNEIKTKDMS